MYSCYLVTQLLGGSSTSVPARSLFTSRASRSTEPWLGYQERHRSLEVIDVFDCHIVEPAIINKKNGSIPLLHLNHRRRQRTSGRLNNYGLKHLCHLSPDNFPFGWSHSPRIRPRLNAVSEVKQGKTALMAFIKSK